MDVRRLPRTVDQILALIEGRSRPAELAMTVCVKTR